MKKLFLLALAVVTMLTSYAQKETSTVYEVYTAEFYLYNKTTEKWDLQTQKTDISLDMVFYKDAINIQAKAPLLLKLKTETKEPIKGDTFTGYRFTALECVNEHKCTVDYVYYYAEPNKFTISILYNDEVLGGVNLRYYSTLKN